MNIYIDESGSFVSAPRPDSWNAVAALALPESARKGLKRAMTRLKKVNGFADHQEVKINKVTEASYSEFLTEMGALNGVLFSIATDSGLNTVDDVLEHQKGQVEKILEYVDKMLYPEGKQGVRDIANQLQNLSPQLYVQLLCQMELIHDVVSRGVNYFVQHHPVSLQEFRWRFDRKNIQKTHFEDAFGKLSPAILQSMSLTRPFIRVREFDYSHMSKYEWEAGKAPTYLRDVYGIQTRGDSFNVGKLLSGNTALVDSKESIGIQASDLLTSGIRKCLRKGFADNERIAFGLGRLMLEQVRREPSIRLVFYGGRGGSDIATQSDTGRLIDIMTAASKPMLKD